MARAALGISTYELADLAGVSRDTIGRIEAGDASLKPKTIAAVQAVLEARGIEFPSDGCVCLKAAPAPGGDLGAADGQ